MTMPAGRLRRPGGRRFTRRTRIGGWSRALDAITNVGTSSAVLLFGFAQSVSETKTTIQRNVMQVNWHSDQEAAAETPFGAMGVCVVTQQAFDAGVASLPDPVTEKDSDVWRVYQPLFTIQGADTARVVQQYHIDSRVKVNLQPGTVLAWVVANQSASAGGVIQVTASIYSQLS